ncbi:MAG: ATP-binding cassette domain-containing protein [Candidatus Aminicenantes bacterium]|nr:ATP-binding cassette domain-containing protein [Candidatus Aminicenantes bacterium]
MNYAVEMEHVSKKFGAFTAVKDLSLKIPRGAVFGLLGPNGAGKTTSIRMMLDIIIPDEGKIGILGRAMNEAMKSKIGYLPEDRGLYPKMKVGEVLEFLAEIKGVPRSAAPAALDKWLAKFELAEWKDKKVEQLSKGMQQKIQFIATVVHDPELIILDEPFGGLDPVNTKLLKDVMLELRADGKTIVFSTHRMEQVEMICDDICLINKGEAVLRGRLQDIKKEYGKNTVVLEYEGSIDFLKGNPDIEKIDDYGRAAEIRLKEKADPQEILKILAGRVRVAKFEIQEPSLNAIFIEKVGRSEQ